jgi:hypothetical protein
VRSVWRQDRAALLAARGAGRRAGPADGTAADRRRDGERPALFEGAAGGNAVVVRRLLADQGVAVSLRTTQRAVADLRQAQRAAALATVRVETAPGDQLQIDFGQKRILMPGCGSGSSCWWRCSVTPGGS